LNARRLRPIAVLAGLTLATGAAGGCTSPGGSGGPVGQPGSIAPSSTARAGAVPTPSPDQNLKTLLQRDATAGSAEVGSFVAADGRVWIDFSCLGTGTAKISYQPVGSVDIPCGGAAVNATRNQVDFPAGQVRLNVTAPDSASWSLLVQQ